MSDGSTTAPAGARGDLTAWLEKMRADLEDDEGRKRSAYKDHLGYWTIGVGRLIDARKGGGLREHEIDYLLDNDILERLEEIQRRMPEVWDAVAQDPVRSRALVNMTFQLGVDGLLTFKNSLGYIARRQWDLAGNNLRASLWAKQTPERADRVIRALVTGIDR